jgi:hypothetical protein
MTRRENLPTSEREATARRLRRYKSVRAQLLNDRGGDPTQAQVLLAENAAGLAMWLEERVMEMTENKCTAELSQVNASMNTLRRLLETLGIERKPKDITTLQAYIDGKIKENGLGDNEHIGSN